MRRGETFLYELGDTVWLDSQEWTVTQRLVDVDVELSDVPRRYTVRNLDGETKILTEQDISTPILSQK